jgi:hypothetical protein
MHRLLDEQRSWLNSGAKLAEMSDQEADEHIQYLAIRQSPREASKVRAPILRENLSMLASALPIHG